MIPLLPDFSSTVAPQALPQTGGSASGVGGVGDLDFAGLLGAAMPRAPAGLPDASSPSAPAGPVPTNKAPAASAPSLPPGALPEFQPILQVQPQPQSKTQSNVQSQAEPLTVPLPFGNVPLPPGGTDLPPSGAIVPDAAFTKTRLADLPQPGVAPPPTLWVKPPLQEKQFAENGDARTETPKVTTPLTKLGVEAPEAILAPEVAAPAAATKLVSKPSVPLETIPLPLPMPPSPLPPPSPTKAALSAPASSPATEAEAPALDAAAPDPSLSDLLASTTPAPIIAPLPVSQAQAAPAVPAPIHSQVDGAARRRGAGAERSAADILPLPRAEPGEATAKPGPSPQFTPQPPAPSTPVVGGLPGPVGDAVVAPALIAPPSPAALAQRPELQAKDVRKAVTTSPAAPAEPALAPLTPPPAAPAGDAAAPPLSLAPSPVPAPASPPPSAMPAAPVIAPAPEPSAAPEPARAAPSLQLEQTINAVGDLREAMRAARPEMTLRHAEFGAVSLRLEAAGAQDWRVVLASRDPGFVPAIQAALAERAVAAAAETSLGGNVGQNGGQNGSGEPRYGSSLGSGQGGSQPYPGQSHSRDEGGFAHHQQQRQQRGSGSDTAGAAGDAGAQAGDGSSRERGLFA